jgi:aspartate-semialdehyde dehydrogenase
MEKIKVGILGATGIVGQKYISLLEEHPWFEVSYVAASPKSAGKSYAEAIKGRWHMGHDIPKSIENIIVEDANNVEKALDKCSFVFSALEMEKNQIKELEDSYAMHIPVVSNASANRWTDDVPMIIPEVNAAHRELITFQKEKRKSKGFIVTKPNCSLQSYVTPVHALRKAGYSIEKMIITTMQALSGAGHPGVSALDITDNLIPYISGEDEKTEKEPLKIFGKIDYGWKKIINEYINISATCTRVPVLDGHTASVSLEFGRKKPTREEILTIWKDFRAEPQEFDLPSAPKQPIVYREEQDRPQPRLDRSTDKAMAVTVGRLRECSVLDYKFVALSHNTIRGAAGGAILTAELLKHYEYIK